MMVLSETYFDGDIKDKPKLLLTGGGGAGSEALARLWHGKYEVHFCDADAAAKPCFITDSMWHHIPMANDPCFIESLLALYRRLQIDLIIPGVDEELLLIARDFRAHGLNVLLPSEDFITTHTDKWFSNSFLHEKGIPVPRTQLCDFSIKTEFPSILKPRVGRGSRNVIVVRSESEIQAHLLLSRMETKDFILQELLMGQEFTVMMVADRMQQLRAVVPVLVEKKKGITLRAYTLRDDAVVKACQAIHAACPVSGSYNIQLIKAANGDVLPFEINPRISTTACLGLAAGIDFVDIYRDMEVINSTKLNHSLLEFREFVTLRRSWYNDITF